MKVKGIICALLLMVAGLQSASAQEAMKVYSGGIVTVYRIENVEQVAFVKLVGEIQLSQTSAEIEKGETLQLTAMKLYSQLVRAKTQKSSQLQLMAMRKFLTSGLARLNILVPQSGCSPRLGSGSS